MKNVVLVVEDDINIVEILTLYLSGSDYEVKTAADGEQALEIMGSETVSVVLADIMMPKMNGYDFIKNVRTFCDAPIIIVSARNQPADKILGLNLGADGYITKPFDPLEVTAYIEAVLRRYHATTASNSTVGEGPTLSEGDLELDVERLILRKRGTIVPLTATELKIVMKFMKSPHRVFTKAQLYECANTGSCLGGEESVMVHISNIRQKLEDDPSNPTHIKTVRGLGYRFEG